MRVNAPTSLREIIHRPGLHLRLLTGHAQLDEPVTRVFVTDLLNPKRYMSGGELVLTGLMWRRSPADSAAFVAACAAMGATAIGAGAAAFGCVPEDLLIACQQYEMPLFEVPVEVSFREISDVVATSFWAQRATGLATVLGRQRGLVAAMAGGARLADLLSTVAADLGARCWLVSPAGRLLYGTDPLDQSLANRFAATFLGSSRVPTEVRIDDVTYSLHTVRGRPEHRLASWTLACTGRSDEPVPPDVTAELVGLAALERVQADEAARVERRLADQIERALAADAADLPSRLRAGGLEPGSAFLAVAARLTGLLTPADLVVTLLADLVSTTGFAAATGLTTATAPSTDTALAILRLDGDGPVGTDPRADEVVARLRRGVETLRPGIGRGQLAVGVSNVATGSAALTGAVQEALHAVAVAGTGPTGVRCAGEITTHALLIAGVPTATRNSFHERVLGPVLEYDRRYRANLVRTLSVFLEFGGSWSQCARQLHLHVNTLRYRMKRIEELTGRDLGRFDDRVDLYLALRIHQPAPG
ncbi:helix-turn-helix domain-containing protein [Micromonospora sp. CPCC 206060]|uniref:helix-turn-helix domain-containing protein n=1 Tax=Micromonospora sp. CPCC 206060 TaxID=3122406 RepID=UPI002FF2C7F4